MRSLVEFAISNGGSDTQIIIPNVITKRKIVTNPSLVTYCGGTYINCRTVDYIKLLNSDTFKIHNDNINQTIITENNVISSDNIGITSDGSYVNIKIPAGCESRYRGLEDGRLVVWDDKLYIYGTRWDRRLDHGGICIYELDEQMNVVNEIIVSTDTVCEKNWMAVSDKPFTFVYYCNPMKIIKVNSDGSYKFIVDKVLDKTFPSTMRGNTCLLRVGDGYMGIVHESFLFDTNLKYQFRFIYLDDKYNLLRVSRPFVFKNDICEFSCGMVISGGMLSIAYSEMDCTAGIVSMPLGIIDEFENYNDNCYTPKYFMQIADEYESKCITATTLYNYVASTTNDMEQRYEATIKMIGGLIRDGRYMINGRIEIMQTIKRMINEYGYRKELCVLFGYMSKCMSNYKLADIYKRIGNKTKSNVNMKFIGYINPHIL